MDIAELYCSGLAFVCCVSRLGHGHRRTSLFWDFVFVLVPTTILRQQPGVYLGFLNKDRTLLFFRNPFVYVSFYTSTISDGQTRPKLTNPDFLSCELELWSIWVIFCAFCGGQWSNHTVLGDLNEAFGAPATSTRGPLFFSASFSAAIWEIKSFFPEIKKGEEPAAHRMGHFY